jgi:hypothetical protein
MISPDPEHDDVTRRLQDLDEELKRVFAARRRQNLARRAAFLEKLAAQDTELNETNPPQHTWERRHAAADIPTDVADRLPPRRPVSRAVSNASPRASMRRASVRTSALVIMAAALAGSVAALIAQGELYLPLVVAVSGMLVHIGLILDRHRNQR